MNIHFVPQVKNTRPPIHVCVIRLVYIHSFFYPDIRSFVDILCNLLNSPKNVSAISGSSNIIQFSIFVSADSVTLNDPFTTHIGVLDDQVQSKIYDALEISTVRVLHHRSNDSALEAPR